MGAEHGVDHKASSTEGCFILNSHAKLKWMYAEWNMGIALDSYVYEDSVYE